MTLRELYAEMGGNYEQAIRVLRIERLMDKHIRKFTKNGVVEAVLTAGASGDATAIFESSHSLKGVAGNLALTGLFNLASELSDEFRPGSTRRFSDEEVAQKFAEIDLQYKKVSDAIGRYEAG